MDTILKRPGTRASSQFLLVSRRPVDIVLNYFYLKAKASPKIVPLSRRPLLILSSNALVQGFSIFVLLSRRSMNTILKCPDSRASLQFIHLTRRPMHSGLKWLGTKASPNLYPYTEGLRILSSNALAQWFLQNLYPYPEDQWIFNVFQYNDSFNVF